MDIAQAEDLHTAFRHLHRRMLPSGSKLRFARNVLEQLKRQNIAFSVIGSHGTGSAIRGKSTVDVFIPVEANTEREQYGEQLITIVAEITPTADITFSPSRARITVFGGKDPAEHIHFYLSPQDPDGWITLDTPGQGQRKGKPLALLSIINDAVHPDAPIVLHLLKIWRTLKNLPFPSLYLDAIAADVLKQSQPNTDFLLLLRQCLERCIATALHPFYFPEVAQEPITVETDEFTRQVSLQKLNTVHKRLEHIQKMEEEGNTAGAFQLWNYIFTGALTR